MAEKRLEFPTGSNVLFHHRADGGLEVYATSKGGASATLEFSREEVDQLISNVLTLRPSGEGIPTVAWAHYQAARTALLAMADRHQRYAKEAMARGDMRSTGRSFANREKVLDVHGLLEPVDFGVAE